MMTDSRTPRLVAPRGAPPLSDHELPGRDDEVIRVRARLLGFTTSERDDHSHPTGYESDDITPTNPAPPGSRCSACRWFEARIMRVSAELVPGCTCDAPNHPDAFREHVPGCGEEPARARYLVLTYGRTRVPGETDKRRAAWTDSAFEVIELLTQRSGGEAFLPAAAARVLAQAAQWDDDLQDAYVNRAVA
jgi:hypothetical protein